MNPCALCGRDPQQPTDRVCNVCAHRLVSMLHDLPVFASQAVIDPREQPASLSSTSRPTPTSRPPLDLTAIDPALATIELVPGDGSSAVPILDALESWVRVVRADNGLVPYGVASAEAHHGNDTTATLRTVCDFLIVWVGWLCSAAHVDVVDFHSHVTQAHRVMSRWDPTRPPRPHWRVSCPTLSGEEECGGLLMFDDLDADPVTCRCCHRVWEPRRLLAVAGGSASVWVDAEAAAVAVGVDASTVRRWARSGWVRRSGQRYALADIRQVIDAQKPSGS